MENRTQHILDLIERLAADAGFTPAEHVCYELTVGERLTLREVAERLRTSRSTAHRHIQRCRQKIDGSRGDPVMTAAVVVAQFQTDPAMLREAKRVLDCLRNEQARKPLGNPNRPSVQPVPDWVPVGLAAKLCGVRKETVQNWIADPKHPACTTELEYDGRVQVCVCKHDIPLLDEYRRKPAPLRAIEVTPDDMVEWRLVGCSSQGC